MSNINQKTLCEIMHEAGSDKGGPNKGHNYTLEYAKLFSKYINTQANVFELGIGTNNINMPSSMGAHGIPGASLRGWKQYFGNAKIYGADIDRDILFEEENIKTYFVDQKSFQDTYTMWTNDNLKNILFDIIIDDGLHEMDANICFLVNSFNKLKPDGIYVIEDIINHTIPKYNETLSSLSKNFNFNYEIKTLEHPTNYWDNTLAIIRKNQ